MSATMTKLSAWESATETLEISDIAGFRLERNLQHVFLASYRGGKPERYYAYGEEGFRKELIQRQSNGYELRSIERTAWLSIEPVTLDGRSWPSFILTEQQVQQLFDGQLVEPDLESRGDIERVYLRFRYGTLCADLLVEPCRVTDPSTAVFRRLWLKLPHRVIRAAFDKARGLPWAKSTRHARAFWRITDRHRAFWTPKATIRWTDKAFDTFERMKGERAYDGPRTLADIIDERLQHARNYSTSQLDSYTLNVGGDGPDSFGWAIIQDQTNKLVYNGGIIWRGDHYTVHT